MESTVKDNSVFVQQRDERINEQDVEFWHDWLPARYAQKISTQTGFSVSLIQKVKRGWKYNPQVVAFLNKVASERKKDLLGK